MKIVLKQDFKLTLNLKPYDFKKGDIVEVDDYTAMVINGNGGSYDIIESDDVLEPEELEAVIEEVEQTEDEAIDAEIERSIVEDEQTEVEALEAATEVESLEKPKKKKSAKK